MRMLLFVLPALIGTFILSYLFVGSFESREWQESAGRMTVIALGGMVLAWMLAEGIQDFREGWRREHHSRE